MRCCVRAVVYAVVCCTRVVTLAAMPRCLCLPCVWVGVGVYRDKIDETCKHHCSKAMKELEACTARVEAKFAAAKPGDEITANCTGQYFDFWHCIDHCVSTLIKITCALYWCVFMHV